MYRKHDEDENFVEGKGKQSKKKHKKTTDSPPQVTDESVTKPKENGSVVVSDF